MCGVQQQPLEDRYKSSTHPYMDIRYQLHTEALTAPPTLKIQKFITVALDLNVNLTKSLRIIHEVQLITEMGAILNTNLK